VSQGDYLFSGNNWFRVEASLTEKLNEEVAGYDSERLLNSSVDSLVTYFTQKFHMDLPVLQEGDISSGQREAEIESSYGRAGFDYGFTGIRTVTGTEYEFHIPFTGDGDMFQIQPTSFSSAPPFARVAKGFLVYIVRGLQLSSNQVRADVLRLVKDINQHLQWLRYSVAAWNGSLPSKIGILVAERRVKLIRDRTGVADLGFKVRERPGASRTFSAPDVRRKILPAMPPASSVPWKPEPVLEMEQYEHILKVISDSALTMERSPAAFSSMGEEDIRTQMLFLLNGHYEGQATGETFNKEGKTDILIRSQGKNVFIGECKFWGGQKVLTETIDQLLGYTSWRDTKVAVIVFNRNKDFSAVLSQIRPTAEAHSNFKRFVLKPSDTQFRFIFTQKDDPAREMTLTIMVFDVP